METIEPAILPAALKFRIAANCELRTAEYHGRRS